MNKDIIQGNWKEIKGRVRQTWGEFTDDEVEHMKGSYEELEGAIQKKYGYNKERTKKELDKFIDSLH